MFGLKGLGKLPFVLIITLLGFVGHASGQNSVALAPSIHPVFLDSTGKPLASGQLFFYAAGTTTLQNTFADSLGTIINPNPVPLDSSGSPSNASGAQIQVWLLNQSYKVCGYNSALVQQFCWDNVSAYQILNAVQNITFGGVTSDPTGAAGEIGYRSDIPCFRSYTTFWDCFVRLTDVQTLTNKTIASPTITGGVTGPTFIISGSANPSTTGYMRLADQDFIKSRNGANSGDLSLIGVDSQGFIDVGDAAGTTQLLNAGTLYLGAGSTTATLNGPTAAGNGFNITLTATNGTGLGVHAGGNVNFAAGLPVNGGVPGAVQVTVGALKLGVNALGFSTTPSLDLSKGNVQQFNCSTAGAAINPSLANILPGESFTFIFVQNGTTACTLNYPGTMHGGTTLSSTLSSINVQEFIVSNNGTDAYAKAAAVSTTGGIP